MNIIQMMKNLIDLRKILLNQIKFHMIMQIMVLRLSILMTHNKCIIVVLWIIFHK